MKIGWPRVVVWGTVFAAGAIVAVTCRTTPESPAVASVGDAVLTLDDLYRSIPPEYRERITRDQNINYVKQWIDNELLYQEALKRKIHKEREMRRRLERMRRDLLSAELLSRQQRENQTVHVSDTMVQEYYERNKETFTRPKEVVRFLQIVVDKYSQALAIRNEATAENFLSLAAKHSSLPAEDPRSVPYIPFDELESGMAGALRNARPGSTRGPVKLDDGYCLLHLLDRQDAGTVATLDEVRDQIVDRLTAEIQKREIDRLLESLRMKTNVTLQVELIPGKTGGSAETPAQP